MVKSPDELNLEYLPKSMTTQELVDVVAASGGDLHDVVFFTIAYMKRGGVILDDDARPHKMAYLPFWNQPTAIFVDDEQVYP